jgi:hypothetical protein
VGGACGTHGREKSEQDSAWKAIRKEPLGRPRRRWEDGIKIELREIGWECVEWIQAAQRRGWWRSLVNTVMNLLVLAPRS